MHALIRRRQGLQHGAPWPRQKPTVWAKPNKGVEERHRRDEEAERTSHRTEADAEAALARGVRMYEKLERGEVGRSCGAAAAGARASGSPRTAAEGRGALLGRADAGAGG